MPRDSFDPELMNALMKLLILPLQNLSQAPSFVLTTAPQLWSTVDLSGKLRLVDMSSVIGRSSWLADTLASGLNSQTEAMVVRGLLAAGWPESAIRLQFRPDTKAQLVVDLAICDVEGNAIAAFEFKSADSFRRDESAVIRRLFSIPTVRWACLTDSRAYRSVSREGYCLESCMPPSPDEFGLSTGSDFAVSTRTSWPLLHPSSPEAVASLFEEHSPASVVLDFTFPLGQRLTGHSALLGLLPKGLAEQLPNKVETNEVLLAAAAARDSVRHISTIQPPGVSFALSKQWLREWLEHRLGIAAHIELPQGIWGGSALIGASYLLLGRRKSGTYFDAVARPVELLRADSPSCVASFTSWLAGQMPTQGYVKTDVSPSTWAFSSNDPEAARTRARLAELGQLKTLSDVADVFMTGPLQRLGTVTDTDESGDAIRIIDARSIVTGTYDEPRFLTPSAPLVARDQLRQNDLLISQVSSKGLHVVRYSDELPSIAGNNVIVVRVSNHGVSPLYLTEFLKSAAAQRLCESMSSSFGPRLLRITAAALRELPFPDIALDMTEVEQVGTLRQQLIDAADDLQARRAALFDSHDLREFHHSLINLKSKSQLLAEAIRLSETLGFQIKNFFPFPLAFGYRLLSSYLDPREKYQEQLRFAENLLAFLGSISIAMLTEEDRSQLAANIIGEWRGGISPGGWKDLVRKCSSLLARYSGNPLAEQLCELKIQSEKKGTFGEHVKGLIGRKNDFKHDRGPKVESDVESCSQEVQELLDKCMDALRFFIQHPIRQVRDNAPLRRQAGRIRLSCLRLIGDHPGFSHEHIDWHEPLTKNDLYLEINDSHWISLFPFIQSLTCVSCKVNEVYFIDKWDGGHATLKSFERGHTESSEETGKDLVHALPVP